MGRSLKKGPYTDPKLMKKLQKQKPGGEPIKTWSRRSTITPDFVGHRLRIHQGRTFVPLTVREEMVGHKLGEFAPTRIFKGHSGAKSKAAAAAALRPAPAAGPAAGAGESKTATPTT